MDTKELISEATLLPVEERALVVDSLLRSLNQPESEIDKKWTVIAQQRLLEMRSGYAKGISGEAVFDRVWKKLETGDSAFFPLKLVAEISV